MISELGLTLKDQKMLNIDKIILTIIRKMSDTDTKQAKAKYFIITSMVI